MENQLTLFQSDHDEISIITDDCTAVRLRDLFKANKIHYYRGVFCILDSKTNAVRKSYRSFKLMSIGADLILEILKENDFEILDFSEYIQCPE